MLTLDSQGIRSAGGRHAGRGEEDDENVGTRVVYKLEGERGDSVLRVRGDSSCREWTMCEGGEGREPRNRQNGQY